MRDYPASLRDLLVADRLMPLGPGTPNETARPALGKLSVGAAFAQPLRDERAARACLAGLWLLHDFLDESHHISQDLDTVDGSYWHAIMHRREPDYENAKYWFRRVGRHPVYAPLAKEAADLARAAGPEQLTGDAWDAFAFVDLCEQASRGDASRGEADLALLCRKVQQAEWRLLFEHCYRQATAA